MRFVQADGPTGAAALCACERTSKGTVPISVVFVLEGVEIDIKCEALLPLGREFLVEKRARN